MNVFFLLSPLLRIVVLVFSVLAASALLFCVVYSLMGRRKKRYVLFLFSLFFSLVITIVTRTPLYVGQNQKVAYIFNFGYLFPAVLGIINFIYDKKILFLADALLCVFNLPVFTFIPYYAFIVCALNAYLLFRVVIFFFDCLESVRKYPGRLSVKYALDGISEGIAFVDRFGRITYVNTAFRNALGLMGISSYNRSGDILSAVKVRSEENGRKVSDLSYLVTVGERSYRFTFDKPLTQVSCTNVSEEERLIRETERNKVLLSEANAELNATLSGLEELHRQRAILAMKGRLHDDLAQQLSILHTFILHDTSGDLRELKSMLSTLEIPQQDEPKNDDVGELSDLLRMIGVTLIITGEPPKDERVLALAEKTIKEASTNAIKHGKANRIDVTFSQTKTEFVITVSNNGALPGTITYGNGLTVLSDEIRHAGGRVDATTADGRFLLRVVFPTILPN